MHSKKLKALTAEQRELIKKLVIENRRLEHLVRTLRGRVEYLERQHVVIDCATAEIPIDPDLVANSDLKQY